MVAESRTANAAHRVEVAGPLEFAPKPADLLLQAQAQKRPEREFDHLALCFEPCYFKGVAHELVVDYDIGPHDVYCGAF